MFCAKCGKEIADASVFCPECGQDLRLLAVETTQAAIVNEPAAAVIQPAANVAEPEAAVIQPAAVVAAPVMAAGTESSYTQFSTAEQKPKATGEIGSKISLFLKEYFKNPIQAVSSRATHEFWLWGLISICAYLFLDFLISLIGISSIRGFGYDFGYLIGNIARFATLIFALYLFQSIFKVKKKSLTSIIAVTGLALLPLVPVYIIYTAFAKVFSNYSIFTGFITAVYIFAGIILYSELKDSSDEKSGFHSLLVVILSFACMPVIGGIIDVIVNKLLYSSYY
ncbi:MAG: zinc ribbon domain-containing protein [Eubacteriales bacterium]